MPSSIVFFIIYYFCISCNTLRLGVLHVQGGYSQLLDDNVWLPQLDYCPSHQTRASSQVLKHTLSL